MNLSINCLWQTVFVGMVMCWERGWLCHEKGVDLKVNGQRKKGDAKEDIEK